MKKGSHYTRFFTQEMRSLETTANLDLLRKRSLESQTCEQQLKVVPLGYEKLAFLFVMLILGYIMSILFALLEYMTQAKKKKEEIRSEDREISSIEEKIGEYLEGLPIQETESILCRLAQKYIQRDKSANCYV